MGRCWIARVAGNTRVKKAEIAELCVDRHASTI